MISRPFAQLVAFSSLIALPNVVACSGEEPAPSASGGASGSGLTGGAAGSSSGAAGAPAGSGGMTGGTSSGGTSGAATGGSSGSGAGTGGAGISGAGGAGSGGVAGGTGGGGAGAGGGAGGNGGGAGGAGGGAAGASGASGAAGAGGGGAFTITTPAFMNMAGCGPMTMAASCATMPVDHTSFGDNISPAMTWTGAPAGTQSFAVVFQDLSNTMAHWVIWNIPANVTMLAENIPKMAMPGTPTGAQQASYLTNEGYAGPGACGNVYEFVVYALSVPTFTPTMATNQTSVRMQLQALGTQILGTASMRARSMMPEC